MPPPWVKADQRRAAWILRLVEFMVIVLPWERDCEAGKRPNFGGSVV